MFRNLLLIVFSCLLFISVGTYASDPGQAEKPSIVEIESPAPMKSQPMPLTEKDFKIECVPLPKPTIEFVPFVSPANPPIAAPTPVPTIVPLPEPTREPVVVYNSPPSFSSDKQYAYAPYEVTVRYTPIQPQPYEYTYCTCLPYGCPAGEPIINNPLINPNPPNPTINNGKYIDKNLPPPENKSKWRSNCSMPGFVYGVVAYPFKVSGKLIYNVGDWVMYTCKETKHTLLDCNCPR